MENYVRPFSLFTEQDIYLFKEGSHFRLYNLLGSHQVKHEDKNGIYCTTEKDVAVRVEDLEVISESK